MNNVCNARNVIQTSNIGGQHINRGDWHEVWKSIELDQLKTNAITLFLNEEVQGDFFLVFVYLVD